MSRRISQHFFCFFDFLLQHGKHTEPVLRIRAMFCAVAHTSKTDIRLDSDDNSGRALRPGVQRPLCHDIDAVATAPAASSPGVWPTTQLDGVRHAINCAMPLVICAQHAAI